MRRNIKIMKYIIIILLIVCLHVSCGQNTTDHERPLLIQTSKDHKFTQSLEIVTACVKDTTKLYLAVIVRFEKKFGAEVRQTSPKEIRLYYISYSGSGRAKHFPDIKEQTAEQLCIWKVCERQFKIWLKEQPYSDMYNIERFYGHNAFSLSYPVILIPKFI